ncbi:MAG: phosphatase PAP2 family protein [Lachnospiraceae bacterium]|nr:phosphatase PAP2 family protein [Lachnospiraceae bacterium]
MIEMIESFDYTILDWFISIQNPILTSVMKTLTNVGEWGILWICIAIVLIIKKSTRHIGITVLLALILSAVVCNGVLKNVVARPRPCWLHPKINMLIGIPTDYSFPSGHTSSSFAAAVAMLAWNKVIGIPAVVTACIMGITRLYFTVHFPTDVIAGAVIGAMLGFVAYTVVNRQKRNLTFD